MSYDG